MRTPTLALLAISAFTPVPLPAQTPGSPDQEPVEVRGPFRTDSGLVYEMAAPVEGPIQGRLLVVLIHGSNLDRRMWPATWEWMPQARTVVRYDWRGHGESPLPDEPYSNAADLGEVLDHAGVDAAVLIGVSAGSQIALDFALAYPDRVVGLVMVAPSIGGYQASAPPEFMAELQAAFGSGQMSRVSDVMLASPIMAVPDSVAGLVDTMVRDNERLWRADPTLVESPARPALGRLGELAAPLLVLVGTEDLPDMLEQARMLGARVEGSDVHRVPGGGHLLNLTSPIDFRIAVEAFLFGLDAR